MEIIRASKLMASIISIVVSVIIFFQSYVARIIETNEGYSGASGTGGVLLAFAMLAGGVVGATARKNKAGGITAGAIFLIGAVIGFLSPGVFGDLVIWSVIALVFGVILIVGSLW